jgi:hypothetical protein
MSGGGEMEAGYLSKNSATFARRARLTRPSISIGSQPAINKNAGDFDSCAN